MNWRIIISGEKSPSENMAIDEAIFYSVMNNSSPPTIRFYDWNPPTVSFGYNQQIEKELDLNILKEKNYGYVRRPTGGRLVLHKNEVTYAVIAPIEGRLAGSIIDSYRQISIALSAGLRNIGIMVEFEKGKLSVSHQRETANPCFTSNSRFELKYKGKKIVGSAQYRKNKFLLQHGSILHNHNQSEVAFLLAGLSDEQRNKLSDILAKKTVAVNDILETKVSFQEVVNSLIAGFRETWGENKFHIKKNLQKNEIIKVKELRIKYNSTNWNYNKLKTV